MVYNTTTHTLTRFPLPADLLPHEDPILFVDKITEFVPGKYIVAEKYVAENNAFFKGHFPGYPLLPGVILTEALFQTCSLYNRIEMMQYSGQNELLYQEKNASGRAIKIENFVFKEEVRPNTKLELKAKFVKRFMRFSVFDCSVAANGKEVAKGKLTTYILAND